MEQSYQQIHGYLEAIYRRKWLLMFLISFSTAIAVVVSFKLPPYYRSSTLILVEHQQVPERYVTPTDKTPIEERLNTIKQQIMSRTKLEQIINQFNLYKSGEDKDNLLTSAQRMLGMKVQKKTDKEEIIELMTNDIEIKVIGGGRSGGDAFSISYSGRDPQVTMQVTNTLASLFIEENLKVREQYAEGTSEFLSNELDKAKQELEEQEKALRKFKEEHMGSLPEQLDANLHTLDRLQLEHQTTGTSLKNLEDRKIMLEEQLSRIAAGPRGAAMGAPAYIVANPLEIELEKLKHELSILLSTYKETYPDVVILKNRINETEGLLEKSKEEERRKSAESGGQKQGAPEQKPELRNTEVYANLTTVKSQIEQLKQRETKITNQIKSFESRVDTIPANEQKMIDIKRDYNIKLQNYQALLEKKLNARLAENLEKKQKGEKFRVIDPANLPEKPYKPNKLNIILMGAMAGTGAGAGLVFLFEFMNPVFRKPEDFTGVLPQPVLGSIPAFSSVVRAKGSKK